MTLCCTYQLQSTASIANVANHCASNHCACAPFASKAVVAEVAAPGPGLGQAAARDVGGAVGLPTTKVEQWLKENNQRVVRFCFRLFQQKLTIAAGECCVVLRNQQMDLF